jgi:hypothetical protein
LVANILSQVFGGLLNLLQAKRQQIVVSLTVDETVDTV